MSHKNCNAYKYAEWRFKRDINEKYLSLPIPISFAIFAIITELLILFIINFID